MTIQISDVTLPVFTRMLGNLSEILKKAEAYAAERKIDPSVLINARLAPDMFPLSRQIQIASDAAKGATARLAGVEVPSFPDTETTFEQLQERIAKTISFIQSIKPEQMEDGATRDITVKAGPTEHHFKGLEFLTTWALPNLFFHVTTAYDILRHNGLQIGKMDYLGSRQ